MGALLDTFTLYELVTSPEQLLPDALAAIAENQAAGTLYVSPITAWEWTRQPAPSSVWPSSTANGAMTQSAPIVTRPSITTCGPI